MVRSLVNSGLYTKVQPNEPQTRRFLGKLMSSQKTIQIPCRHLFHEENDEMLAMFPYQSEDYESLFQMLHLAAKQLLAIKSPLKLHVFAHKGKKSPGASLSPSHTSTKEKQHLRLGETLVEGSSHSGSPKNPCFKNTAFRMKAENMTLAVSGCESMELDNKIQILIKKNIAPDPHGVTPEAMQSHRESCSLESSLSRKNLTKSLEQKIRCLEKQRKELLEVNQQWDQQFRSMKEFYKTKVSELKTKLAVAEGVLRTLEKEQRPGQSPGDPRREKEKESLNEELEELKKENKLLKEKNALTNKKKEHYECEIKRLNKALQDVLKIQSSFSMDYAGKCKGECSHEDMRTELEVLRHQVQIYEEDFKKERLDRERLSQEKEHLQKLNEVSQSQMNRLSSQIQAYQMEKEKLGMQLKQMYFLTCNGGLPFHLRDPWVPVDPRLIQNPWPQSIYCYHLHDFATLLIALE
uniref:TNFAIP3-interacting protein 3 n=1 Tax=Jaculus jaculus TaxID=51337 RepID=UPI001E1B4295|nr:TNFAIP3-interacting protein 3 [Jaculus jaculus]